MTDSSEIDELGAQPAPVETGVGLSVAYGISKQHDGWLAVASELGEGSRFRLWLPALQMGAASAVGDQEPKAAAGSFGGLSVLLLEDDTSIRRVDAKLIRTKRWAFLAKPFSVAELSAPLERRPARD